MPQIGEISRSKNYDKLIWIACASCAIERWVKVSDTRKPAFTTMCRSCVLRQRNGELENSPKWKGGVKHCGGYVLVYLPPNHPLRVMCDELGYVKNSRLVMATVLDRPLSEDELVHHINNIKNDDRPENLHIYNGRSLHTKHHRLEEIKIYGQRPRNEKGQFLQGGLKLCHP